MGTINKGILGGFSGTVGNVIGGNWKGIDYIRSRPSTDAQKDQRLKFAIVMRFFLTIAGLLGQSFRTMAVKMTGINSAVSYCLRNAVGGVSPVFVIDYSLVLVSRGDLPMREILRLRQGRTATLALAGRTILALARRLLPTKACLWCIAKS